MHLIVESAGYLLKMWNAAGMPLSKVRSGRIRLRPKETSTQGRYAH